MEKPLSFTELANPLFTTGMPCGRPLCFACRSLIACCNIAGLDQLHKRFFKRLVVGGSLFALSSIFIQLLLAHGVPLPFVMLGLVLLFGVSGEISPLHGHLLPASLITAVFTLGLTGNVPLWLSPLLYLAGTAWYGLFNALWFRLWQEQPMREALSLLYRKLVDYIEAKYSLLTQHTNPDSALPPLFARQQKVIDQIAQVYQQLHMLSTNHLNQYKRLLRAFQVALDLQEHILVSLHQPDEVPKAGAAKPRRGGVALQRAYRRRPTARPG